MYAQVNGIRLFYTEHGQGLPVLLIHAFPVNSALWQEQIAQHTMLGNVRLIVPDLRGFGQSDTPEGPYRMETLADDLAALLDHLAIERAVLAGVSMGGYIAFAFFRRHAERLQGLVLANTRAIADSEEGKAGRETNAQLALREGVGIIADMMLPKLVAPTAPDELKANLRAIIEQHSPVGIAGALRGMALRPESVSLLPQINVPTLLVGGRDDQITQRAEYDEMHAGIPGSELVIIEEAGHLACFEKPTAFNAAVATFLKRLGA